MLIGCVNICSLDIYVKLAFLMPSLWLSASFLMPYPVWRDESEGFPIRCQKFAQVRKDSAALQSRSRRIATGAKDYLTKGFDTASDRRRGRQRRNSDDAASNLGERPCT